ncbi:MAG: cell division protein ZapA [Candidatus Kapabacteria bacterium]|nr:cell division protein ZapA [Candidatus Kapabacteria bacterium]
MKTVIAGKEYNLRTDNEKLLARAADLVNSEMNKLGEVLQGESQATIAVLTALNISEKYLTATEQSNFDKEYLLKEMQRMTEQIDKQMSAGIPQK